MEPENETVRGLARDIAVIKDAVRRNSGLLRHILAAGAMRGVAFAIAALCVILPLLWEATARFYGSLSAAPAPARAALWALTAAAVAAIGVWKAVAFTRSARRVDSRYTYASFVNELTDHPVFACQGAVLVTTAVVLVSALQAGSPAFAFAAVAGGIGTVFALYAIAFLLREYLVTSFWLYLVTVVATLAPGIPVAFLVVGGFGAGFLLMGLMCPKAPSESGAR